GDGRLREKSGANLLDGGAKALDGDVVVVENPELRTEQEKIEAFGVLVVVANRGGETAQFVGKVAGFMGGEFVPGGPVAVVQHVLSVGAAEDVVEVHTCADLVRVPRSGVAQVRRFFAVVSGVA